MEIGQIRGSMFPVHLRNLSGHVPRSSSLSPTLSRSSTKSENRMFILGMGFVGQLLAHKLHNQGWVVSGTCTSHVKKKQLEGMGFHVHLFDANYPELSILGLLKNHTHLLVSVPPVVGVGDPMLQHEELIKSSLVNGDLQWLCYLSSTSVYGDCGGELVDEDCPTNPESESAKLRLASEEGWSNLGHYLGISPLLFRLGGIYGPGRREVYNIVDDDPAPREEVFEYARKLVEKKWPGLLNIQPSEHKECSVVKTRNPRGEKRVSNARMKKELGAQLLYPDYRTGLQSIIDQIDSPFSCD